MVDDSRVEKRKRICWLQTTTRERTDDCNPNSDW
jgi:hypothetical protein